MTIVECPRDAMQGLDHFIPTELKISYINQLLKIGFDTIDFGSFVSPKAIPQMKDTARVLSGLELDDSQSSLLAIVANLRGAILAAEYEEIDFIGFPLSISETFQRRNTNRSIEEALNTVEKILELCDKSHLQLVTYLSMGFGNPYNDPYHPEVVADFTRELDAMGVSIISLADTIGVSNPQNISYLFQTLIPEFPGIQFGAHLHSHPDGVKEKISAAYNSGCRRFDGAIRGFGGCPMAKDQLVGNLATETMIDHLNQLGADLSYDQQALSKAILMVQEIFSVQD